MPRDTFTLPGLMDRFFELNNSSVRSYRQLLKEGFIERVLIHLLELRPIRNVDVHSLEKTLADLDELPLAESVQQTLMEQLERTLEGVVEPDAYPVHGVPFLFAPPGHGFVASKRVRSFFPNINQALGEARARNVIVEGYVRDIQQVVKNSRVNKLCFIDKAFGPLGAVELRPLLMEKMGLPGVVYRAYSWKQHLQPFSAGSLNRFDRLCVVYDVGISGGMIDEFATYVEKELEADVLGAVVFFDYEEGARKLLESKDIEYRPILTKSTALPELKAAYYSLYKSDLPLEDRATTVESAQNQPEVRSASRSLLPMATPEHVAAYNKAVDDTMRWFLDQRSALRQQLGKCYVLVHNSQVLKNSENPEILRAEARKLPDNAYLIGLL